MNLIIGFIASNGFLHDLQYKILRHAVGPNIFSIVTYVDSQYGQSTCHDPSSFICLGGGEIPNAFNPAFPFFVIRSDVQDG